MNYVHFLNGRWVKQKDLLIPGMDLGILRGYGVFDDLRTHGRAPLWLDRNLNRLAQSAKILKLKLPYSKTKLTKIIKTGIAKNHGELFIRMVLTGGVGPDRLTPGKPNFFILFTEVPTYSKNNYLKGIKTITWTVPRSLPEVKSLNYLQAVLATQAARRTGAGEALYVDPAHLKRRLLYEGATSTLFVIKNGTIITPRTAVLFGVTASAVMDTIKSQKLPLIRQNIYYANISHFDEAFITSTSRLIMPIVKIDNRTIGSGRPGPITNKLIADFQALLARTSGFKNVLK